MSNKKMMMVFGACAAMFLSAPLAEAQAGNITEVKGSVNSVSIQADNGVVAIQMETYASAEEGPTPVQLCPGASSEAGKYVAYVPDLPQYRTLLEQMFQVRSGTVTVREGRDGRCYVTRFSHSY